MHGVDVAVFVGQQHVLEHHAQPRGVDPHLGRADAVGNVLTRGLQSLEHQLPGEVDIGAVLEDDRHHGQARFGNRADFRNVGQ